MAMEIRLEVNLDILDKTIEPEKVRQDVRNVLDKLPSYLKAQSVLIIVHPK